LVNQWFVISGSFWREAAEVTASRYFVL
jgi:hypothetical protein